MAARWSWCAVSAAALAVAGSSPIYTPVFDTPSVLGAGTFVDGMQNYGSSGAFGGPLRGGPAFLGTVDGAQTWAPFPVASGAGVSYVIPCNATSCHTYGSITDVPAPFTPTYNFTSSGSGVWSVGEGGFASSFEPTASVTFGGLPEPVSCNKFDITRFGGCPFRLNGGDMVTLSDGTLLYSAIVYWGGNGPFATSLVVYASVNGGYEWNFRSVVANASAYPASQEGPNENAMTVLADGKTLLIIARLDGGDGPETHPYKPYYTFTSADNGMTWSSGTPLPNAGCVRPKLQIFGGGSGPLVLTGGRFHYANTSDVLMWINDDGMGSNWRMYSLSYYHNLNEPNATLRFTADVNSTNQEIAETTSYTSLGWLPDGDAATGGTGGGGPRRGGIDGVGPGLRGVVVYARLDTTGHGDDDDDDSGNMLGSSGTAFAMRFSLEASEG